MRTLQEAFDISYKGLKSQGFERSADIRRVPGYPDIPICRYRNMDGKRCAVGWLIPDEKYKTHIEGTVPSVTNETGREMMRMIEMPIKNLSIEFLSHLQIAHDSSKEPEEMERRLKEVAAEFDLTVPSD